MSEVVATRPFEYAGTYRYSGEVFELGGFQNDSALLAVGYIRAHESTGEEVEDDAGRAFVSERHAELAHEHQRQRDAERVAKEEARRIIEGRFEAREAALAEERRAHGDKWYCPSAAAVGGCGRPVSLGGIAQHIEQHAEPNRSRIQTEHEAQHAAVGDRSVPASANIAANTHADPTA